MTIVQTAQGLPPLTLSFNDDGLNSISLNPLAPASMASTKSTVVLEIAILHQKMLNLIKTVTSEIDSYIASTLSSKLFMLPVEASGSVYSGSVLSRLNVS